MNRLLITGAAGGLGRQARTYCADFASVIRLTDIAPMDAAGPIEEVVYADLSDKSAVSAVVQDCDAIVHFGGISTEKSFEAILQANIRGVFNLYEAARTHGVKRIVFASSNHAIGFYRTDQILDGTEPPFADGLYGASKVYGEQLALIYWKKFGIETARIRIGSSFPEPKDRRMLTTWMSYSDLFALIKTTLSVPRLGCPVIYGQSRNAQVYWDNGPVAWLGWHPRDSSEVFREKIESADPSPDATAPEYRFQGGVFTAMPIYDD